MNILFNLIVNFQPDESIQRNSVLGFWTLSEIKKHTERHILSRWVIYNKSPIQSQPCSIHNINTV